MKNSDEWLKDIEQKLNERYDRRNKRRKAALQCASGVVSCSLILMAAIALPKNIMPSPKNEHLIENSTTNVTTPHKEDSTFIPSTLPTDNSSAVEPTTEQQDTSISDIKETTAKSEPNSTGEVTVVDPTENISPTQTQPDEIVQVATEPSDIPEPPTQQIVEPTVPPENDIHINKIVKTSPIVDVSGNWQPSEDVIWTYQQMTEYYGIDFGTLPEIVFSTGDYEADICDEYTVKIYDDCSMKSDLYEIEYYAPSERYIKISASKVAYPYDCVYVSENKETSMIQDNAVIIGGMAKNGGEINDFFYADFQKYDINYRFIGENLSDEEFCSILSNFIKL